MEPIDDEIPEYEGGDYVRDLYLLNPGELPEDDDE